MRIKAALLGLTPLLIGFSLNSSADYEDGRDAAFAGDYELAYFEFRKAAEEGLDMAQYNLGILYYFGQGVDKNLEEAFRWTQLAAEQGHPAAQFNLGNLYFAGDGADEDLEQSLEWYGSAARAGHAAAAYLIATMYDRGGSATEDLVLAHAWASIAIRNEHEQGQAIRDIMENRMDADQLSQARRLFARWQIQ